MKKTCRYCGVVPEDHVCPYRRNMKKIYYRQRKRDSAQDEFRHSEAWKKKSVEIRERDLYICQVCKAGLYNPIYRYEYRDLEVHHIVPLIEDPDLGLDNENLITLCNRHHRMAEKGIIPRAELLKLVNNPPLP